MRFGSFTLDQVHGGILAHSIRAGSVRFRKGLRLGREEIARLEAAGITEVVAALLDPGDLDEDEAARRVASALRNPGVEAREAATGRVNLHAQAAGVFTVDRALIDTINRIDPAVTVATLEPFASVDAGRMVATVKIIPFAVAETVISQVEATCARAPALAVHPFASRRVGLIQTMLPGTKPSILDKTTSITQDRLLRSGSTLLCERRTVHRIEEVAEAIGELMAKADLVLAFGASAMSDADDVLPAAIRMSGGVVDRVGMPVDPGNLLVLGRIDGKPVIGAPGCARSPKENGFDWILDRLIAGVDVTGDDVAAMGVGGLLMEVPARPQPREAGQRPRDPLVQALVLAAGRSSRMGGANKLLARFGNDPLVRMTVSKALASKASGVTVVTGYQSARICEALRDMPVSFAHNENHADGLSGSLNTGIAACPEEVDGALVMLGDMPALATADLDRLIDAFVAARGQAIIRATHGGRRGNPVLLPRAMFAELALLRGDIGARHIVESSRGDVIDVEIGSGAVVDVDTPEAMAAAGGVLVNR